MNKEEYFLRALTSGAFKNTEWAISAFSVPFSETQLNPTALYDYKYVYQNGKHGFLRNGVVETLDADPSLPLFVARDPLMLTVGDLINLETDVETTYGRAFVNHAVLCYAFGNKIPYINRMFSARDVERTIEPTLTDDPADPAAPRSKEMFYVSELLRYTESVFALTAYSQIFIPAASEKTMQAPPGIKEFRDALLEKNKDRLTDPSVIASIDKALVDYDKAWLAGDESEGFFSKEKSFNVVRKKLYLMHGAESSFSDGTTVELIPNSLEEGWDIEKLPAVVNSLREGSYSRGALTALGGEAVKFFYRVMQNFSIEGDDCGSGVGVSNLFTEANYKQFVGFWMVKPKGSILLDTDLAKANIGKVIQIRSPLYCLAPHTTFCERCMGVSNSKNPTGLGAAASDVGSTFLNTFMGLMHGRALTTAIYEHMESIT